MVYTRSHELKLLRAGGHTMLGSELHVTPSALDGRPRFRSWLFAALLGGVLPLGAMTLAPTESDELVVVEATTDLWLPGEAVELEDEASSPEMMAGRIVDQGSASFYGAEFAGSRTANGERFNPDALTAAHPSLPMGSTVRVTNVRNGNSVIVRINDRGPFAKNRVIDVSKRAARDLGFVQRGTAPVTVELLPVERS